MDNNQSNALNESDNIPSFVMGDGTGDIIENSEPAKDTIETVGGAEEIVEVQALPENEAFMAYCEVHSDMPSIGGEPFAQHFSAPVTEPSQMSSVSPAEDNVRSMAAITAELSESSFSAESEVSEANTKETVAPSGLAETSNAYISPVENRVSTNSGLHNPYEDGIDFSVARKSKKSKNTPTVSDAYEQYPEAPLLQKSTGRPLSAEEARKFYATYKPVEKVEEPEVIEAEPEETKSDKVKIVIYLVILALTVIVLLSCVAYLLIGKPVNYRSDNTSNNSSTSFNANSDQDKSSSYVSGESVINGTSGDSTSADVTSQNSAGTSPADTDHNKPSSEKPASQTSNKPSNSKPSTTTKTGNSSPSATTVSSSVAVPGTPATQSSSKPQSSTPQSSTTKSQTNVPESSTTESQTNVPQSSTTNPQNTTTEPQTTTTTKPQTTTAPQTEPPTPVSTLYSVKLITSSEWPQEGNTGQRATFRVRNNSGSDMGDWTLVLKIDGLVSINCWSADCTISGNTLTIKKVYQFYETGLLNDGTYDVDCTIVTKNGVKITSATLNGSAVEIIS